MAIARLDLRSIAGKFLAERERNRILQMRAADFDDAREFSLLLGQCARFRCVSAGMSMSATSITAAT